MTCLRFTVVLLLFTTCGRSDETTVHGTVVDAHTGAPVAGARLEFRVRKGYHPDSTNPVTVEERTVTAGPDGAYTAVLETRRADGIDLLVYPGAGYVVPGHAADLPEIRPGGEQHRINRAQPEAMLPAIPIGDTLVYHLDY